MSSVHQVDFIHEPLSEGEKAIRILYLRPADGYHDEIHCSLGNANLEDTPYYKALSYVWGDPSVTVPIFVDGAQYHVTVNCYTALLRLRQAEEICLWIDAICINQNDDAEKSVQVALMGDVYFLAEQVIVWLGIPELKVSPEAEVDEGLAFSLLLDLARFQNKHGKDANAVEVAAFLRKDCADIESWRAMVNFFHHPWFERIWVYQEFVLSADTRLLSNFHFTNMMAMDSAIETYTMSEGRFRLPWESARFNIAQNMWRVRARFYYLRKYNREARRLSRTTVLDVMEATSAAKCYDPRDRVFAIVGLFSKKKIGRFKIDYSASLSRVYTDFARYMIKIDNSLDCLCFDRPEDLEPIPTSELPSWVCDWRTERRCFFAIFGFFLNNVFEASLSLRPKISFGSSGDVLEAHGVQVDTVKEIFQILNDGKTTKPLEVIMKPAVEGYTRWNELFQCYPNGCEPLEAWVRTITLDLGANGDRLDEAAALDAQALMLDIIIRCTDASLRYPVNELQTDSDDHNQQQDNGEMLDRKGKAINRRAEDSVQSAYEKVSEDSKEASNGTKFLAQEFHTLRIEDDKKYNMSGNFDYDISRKQYQRSSGNNEYHTTQGSKINSRGNRLLLLSDRLDVHFVQRRAFFITESGYMGLGPLGMRQGDIVSVILGASTPLLIRDENEYHRLVGQCFVWGLMDGEAVMDRLGTEMEYDVFRLR